MFQAKSLRFVIGALAVAAFATAHGETEPRGADQLRKLAYAAYEQGQNHEALFYYSKALKLDPRHRAALAESGLVQIRLGNPGAAEVQLERLRKACGSCKEADQLARAVTQATAVLPAPASP